MEKPSNPKYNTIKQAILGDIESGALRPNDRLPSDQEYAEQFSVSHITVRKAMTDLANEGYIRRVKGTGSFVRQPGVSAAINSHLIAMILAAEDSNDVSYMQIIRGAQKLLSDKGYSLIVEWADKNSASESNAIDKMLERNVEGTLIYPFDPVRTKNSYQLLTGRKIPYVLLDRYSIDCPTPYVGCSNFEGGVLATQALLRLNHRKIKFISYDFFLSSEQERFDGYCSAMFHAGLPAGLDNLIQNLDYDALAHSISCREVTALVCCNDRLAYLVMEGLLARGIQIPQQVSIMGFDDWQYTNRTGIGLSTVKQDFEEIGRLGAVLLLNELQGLLTSENVKLLAGVRLLLRDSTAGYEGN